MEDKEKARKREERMKKKEAVEKEKTERRKQREEKKKNKRSSRKTDECRCPACGTLYKENGDTSEIWIECETCNKWYHWECTAVLDPNNDVFICSLCS